MANKPNVNTPVKLEFCEAEHKRGVSDGNGAALAIYLTVMRDKFGFGVDKLYKVWKRTEHECTAISFDGHLIARYEREQRDLIKRDICPMMADIVHAYKPPKPPAKYKDAMRCYRQGREAGWQFCTLVFLRALRWQYGWARVRLNRVYDAACEQRDSLNKGYINTADLETVLFDEAGIKVV